METKFTLHELRMLSHLVCKERIKVLAAADSYAKSNILCDDYIFGKLAVKAEQEFELFNVLESKLEKMKTVLWAAG
ncbi:hypothetical protein [Leptospira alexanderi]|uniref:hypothetical protein n=1 Tax=Leptospira alexanderi TaxID=100053 RepID=UPI000990E619|nr:hypothetical protein [Leptospira alexanderi]